MSSEHAAAECFGLDPRELVRLHAFSPVFRALWREQVVVLKRTQRPLEKALRLACWLRECRALGAPLVAPLLDPVLLDDECWALYPYVAGGMPSLEGPQLEECGACLGQLHSIGQEARWQLPAFQSLECTLDSRAEDLENLSLLLKRVAPGNEALAHTLSTRVEEQYAFRAQRLRESDLPLVNSPFDFKANNLVQSAAALTLIDPDRAARVPRIIDLALAALLFCNEAATPSPLSRAQWQRLMTGYQRHIQLTPEEHARVGDALAYVWVDEAFWLLCNDDGWHRPEQGAFLRGLLAIQLDDYRFSSGDGDETIRRTGR